MSEGVSPFVSMLSQNDSVDQEAGVFEVIEEESWRGTNRSGLDHKYHHHYCDLHDRVHGPQGNSRGHRKLTRQRREIFPDYEKRVQERVLGEVEDEEENKPKEEEDEEQEECTEHCDNSNSKTVNMDLYVNDKMMWLIWYSPGASPRG